MEKINQYCTFRVDNILLGIEVLQVQEVIRFHETTRVPLAPRVVRGLINLRGQIVMAIDLRRRLELTPRDDEEQPLNVVVRTIDGPVSLLADEIGDVLDLDPTRFEDPPETVPDLIRDVLIGIHTHNSQLLLIIDPERVVQMGEVSARIA